MSSRRDRDRSTSPRRERRRHEDDRDRDHGHRKRKQRIQTPESDMDLLNLRDLGIDKTSEEDYFLRSTEFKVWLKDARNKFLDELSSDTARKYFRKFLRRWNDGALPKYIYRAGGDIGPSSSTTAYKWTFASKSARPDAETISAIRADVSHLTHTSTSTHSKSHPAPRSDSDSDTNPVGPSLPPSSSSHPYQPTTSDRQLAIESTQEAYAAQRKHSYKENYRKADELVPKSGGKEGKMEEKRAVNAGNRELREKEVGGLEVDEGTLLGESGSFAAALRARDAVKAKRDEKKGAQLAERRAADEERLAERKRKDADTMDMFKAMARERFG